MYLVDFARFGKFSEALKTFCPHADGSIQPTKTVVNHDTCKFSIIHVQNTFFFESVEENVLDKMASKLISKPDQTTRSNRMNKQICLHPPNCHFSIELGSWKFSI